MASDLISKRTRNGFREFLVSYTLHEISMEFDAAGIDQVMENIPNISGQRRILIEQYYRSIDWSNRTDVNKILKVYESVLSYIESQARIGVDWGVRYFSSLKNWIERDGFKYEKGELIPCGSVPSLRHVAEVVRPFDLPELHRQIQRMQNAIEEDPALAIGTAKELVESVCKTILEQRHVQFENDADIGTLVKVVRVALKLDAENIPHAAKGAESIRRILSNLGNVAQGLGELRNLYGTGHGKSGKAKGLTGRHARLAVGSAATLATFLFETHIERGED